MVKRILRRWFGIEQIEVRVREQWIAALGGGLSILIVFGMSCWAGATAIIASMGASAVLLFD